MGGRSRQRIFGDRVQGARINAQNAREQAKKAIREADAAECLLWSEQMEGFGGPAQPSPTIAQCLNGGYGWLEVMCHRCETRASLPLDAIRRPRDTPIWKLEAALKCRSCATPGYAPPVHLIRLTKERKIAPYPWVHPDRRSVTIGPAGRSFEHARKLVHATDLQEAMRIQSEFLKSQFTNAGEHMRQITGGVMNAAKDATKDKL